MKLNENDLKMDDVLVMIASYFIRNFKMLDYENFSYHSEGYFKIKSKNFGNVIIEVSFHNKEDELEIIVNKNDGSNVARFRDFTDFENYAKENF